MCCSPPEDDVHGYPPLETSTVPATASAAYCAREVASAVSPDMCQAVFMPPGSAKRLGRGAVQSSKAQEFSSDHQPSRQLQTPRTLHVPCPEQLKFPRAPPQPQGSGGIFVALCKEAATLPRSGRRTNTTGDHGPGTAPAAVTARTRTAVTAGGTGRGSVMLHNTLLPCTAVHTV